MIRPARPLERARQEPSRGDFGQSPLLVFYEATQACDLACTHCRASAQPTAHPEELTTEQSLRLIDQLAEFPSLPMLVLTGGDPLKREDIFSLVRRAARRGLNVSITPSATRLTTLQAIQRLRYAGISRMAISIDGADATAHDTARGVTGSFDQSLKILANARAEGISTQVNTTITPRNAGQIERMAELLARQGIAMWSVFFLVPTGRACEFRYVCGGSRARAYAVTGNPFAEEPDCAYVPDAVAAT